MIKKDDVICDIETDVSIHSGLDVSLVYFAGYLPHNLFFAQMFTFGLSTDDNYESIMGDILGEPNRPVECNFSFPSHVSLLITITMSSMPVPENSDPVPAGTALCTTFNEGHDD